MDRITIKIKILEIGNIDLHKFNRFYGEIIIG
jgi:hypothetical protein